MFPIDGIRTLRLGAEHAPALQGLLERCHAFHQMVHGTPPGPGEAEHLLQNLPDGKTADDKLVIGLFEDGVEAPAGVLDLIRDCPERGECSSASSSSTRRGEAPGSARTSTPRWSGGSGARPPKGSAWWCRSRTRGRSGSGGGRATR